MGLNDVKISTLTNLKLFNRLFRQKWLFGNVINYPHCVKIVQIRSFFWFVFSRIRTEYGEILRISLYSIQMRENKDSMENMENTAKTPLFGHFSCSTCTA